MRNKRSLRDKNGVGVLQSRGSRPSARPPCYVRNPASSAVKHALRMDDVTGYDGSEVDYEVSEVLGEVGEKTLQR